jgi:hypothetical protein
MLREYTKKSADEVAELKEMIRLAEDNDIRNTRQIEQMEAVRGSLMRDNEELRRALEHYKQLCIQN